MRYLEHLQSSYYTAHSLPIPDFGMMPGDMKSEINRALLGSDASAERIAEIDSYVREYMLKAQEENPLTRFENPGWHGVLNMHFDHLEAALQRGHRDIPPRPLVGTLATGRVNAMAVSVPNTSKFLILFEDGLFGFANLIAKAFVGSIPVTITEEGANYAFSTEDWLNAIDATDIVERMGEILYAYLVMGHPHRSRPFLLPSKYQMAFAGDLRNAMELFVLGHELGHVCLGHFRKDNEVDGKAGISKAEVIKLSHADEYEADAFGAELMTSVLLDEGLSFSLANLGAGFFLQCIDLVEETIAQLRGTPGMRNPSETHPPTQARLMNLISRIENSAMPESEIVRALHLLLSFDTVGKEVLSRLRSVSARLYDQNVQLAPAWANVG